MPAVTAALLERLRELQAAFSRAVREGDWDAASRLQADRFCLMDTLCAGARPADDGVAGALAQIAAADRELLPDLEQARAACAAQLGELRQARRALKAYDP
jgi:hypothetical protein